MIQFLNDDVRLHSVGLLAYQSLPEQGLLAGAHDA